MCPTRLYKEFAKIKGFESRFNKNETLINNKNPLRIEMCNFLYFDKIRKQLNIGFKQPTNDKCYKCTIHDLNEVEKELCECDICINYNKHIENFTDSRNSMHSDSSYAKNESNLIVVTLDAQKTISMPVLPLGTESYFSAKISAYNQTFCEIGENGKAFCFLLNDTQTDKKSREYTNIVLKFLKTDFCKTAQFVIFWSDNCYKENKNWLLFSNLIKIVNDSTVNQQKITFKYLESGHTYMSCDSLHAKISEKFKKEKVI
jgi:hypothetical protein